MESSDSPVVPVPVCPSAVCWPSCSGRGLAEFKTDITDEGDYYELKADLPGFKKEDIQLQLDGPVCL